MSVFFLLLTRLLPLYALVLAGYIAGKYLKVQKETIASLLIYIIVPVVIFSSISQARLDPSYLLVPVMFFSFCSLMCIVFYKLGQRFTPGPTRNLLAFSAGDANTGYFGLPVAIQLFGDSIVGIAVLFFVGFVVYENSVGFYIAARGHHTVKEAAQRVAKLPTIYAFLLGLLCNYFDLKPTGVLLDFANNMRGTYSVLGMMMIGFGAASIKNFKLDYRFIFWSFLAKFVVWPALILCVIAIDSHYLHFFDPALYKMMILISAVPLAANTVAISTELRLEPEKAAVAVLLSTVFALGFIPLVTVWFIR